MKPFSNNSYCLVKKRSIVAKPGCGRYNSASRSIVQMR